MPLKSIRLRNFRSFVDTGEVPIGPITVLVGENSSGKSSLARFFPLVKQSLERETEGPFLWYGPDVDFGDFSAAVWRGAPEGPIGVELCFAAGGRIGDLGEGFNWFKLVADSRLTLWVELVAGRNELAHLDYARDGARVRIAMPGRQRVLGFEFSDGTVFRPLGLSTGVVAQEALIPQIAFTVGATSCLGWGAAQQWALDGAAARLQALFTGLEREAAVRAVSELLRTTSPADLAGLLEALAAREGWTVEPSMSVADALPPLSRMLLLADCFALVHHARTGPRVVRDGLAYIGPHRVPPARVARLQNVQADQIEMDGANLAVFLSRLSEAEQQACSDWCEEWLGFGLRLGLEGGLFRVSVRQSRGPDVNVADMGFGVGQVLPIAVQLWALGHPWGPGSRRPVGMVVLEQPELHLHPRLQARLADAILAAVTAARRLGHDTRVVVETHSEAMINRLGELVELGRLPAADCAVVLFEKPDFYGPSRVTVTGFDDGGVLRSWPFGFFQSI